MTAQRFPTDAAVAIILREYPRPLLLTAWLYDRARGSVLPAAVLHAVLDVLFLADVGVPTQSVLGAVVTVAGLAVVADRIRHTSRRRPTPEVVAHAR